MADWDLSRIRQKVRQVTGRLSENEMTTNELNTRINQYYQYTFPAEVKLDYQFTFYEFLTTPNQPTYDIPSGYTNFEPEATIDEYSLLWYQDPARYYADNWKEIAKIPEWTGDGSTVTFTTTVTGFPIWPATVIITDNTEVFEDTNETFANSPVTLTGSLGGTATVNYSTGSVSVTFNTAPDDGQNIYLSYAVFAAKRPQSILYFNNQFSLFPIPDTAYKIRMQAYQTVSALSLPTDTPRLSQWGPCIAYGTARDIHADFGEMDAYAEVTALYKEQVRYVLNRTEENYISQRSVPRF